MSEERSFRIARAFFVLLERLNTDTRQRDEARDEEQTRKRRGTIAICDVRDREQVTLFGSLLSMIFPSQVGKRVLVVTLYGGTASTELRWLERRSVPGLYVGEHIEVEGTAGVQGDHLMIPNPLYRIIVENTWTARSSLYLVHPNGPGSLVRSLSPGKRPWEGGEVSQSRSFPALFPLSVSW